MVDRQSSAVPLDPAKEGRLLAGVSRLLAAGPVTALSRLQLVCLFGIFAVATLLRLHGLATWPLEQDEVYTLQRAYELDRLNARPLFFLIERAVLEVLPHTEFYLRIPALLFGLAGLWATWALGRRISGPVAGIVAVSLAAISPWHMYVSQFARYWSLVYLAATLLYWILPRALDTDGRHPYLAALATVGVGTLSHPTFAFPVVGYIFGLAIIGRSGEAGWRRPSRRARMFLWGPLAATGVTGFALLAATGNLGTFRNGDPRGLAESLRLVPAMAQWATPTVVAAAAVGGVWLLATRPADRRWAVAALLGCVSCLSLLLLASSVTAVYSDYGVAMLPLVYITIGCAVQRLGESLQGGGARAVPAAVLAVLTAGILPGTLSHLSDGTRHDARPAFAYISAEMARGRWAPVYGPTRELQRFYAPDLPYTVVRPDSARLASALSRSGGLWLIGFYRRNGMILASEAVEGWSRANCHSVLTTSRPRLDYRVYRVELHWCGHGAAPRDGGR